MTTRPIIGVSCMNVGDERGGVIAVRPTYVRAVEAAGGVALLIPTSDDMEALRALYELCDGVLLPGGEDVDPAHYGEEPHPQLGPVDRQRDGVELALARWSRDDRKPLMGICRGFQVINVAFGGSLYQDIPSQLPEALDHRANTHAERYDFVSHPVALAPGCWLAEALGTTEIGSNTMHHQALKAVAPGLRLTGQSPDGVAEAFEGTGEQFVVGVQGHPEHLWFAAEERWARLFQGFVQRCRQA